MVVVRWCGGVALWRCGVLVSVVWGALVFARVATWNAGIVVRHVLLSVGTCLLRSCSVFAMLSRCACDALARATAGPPGYRLTTAWRWSAASSSSHIQPLRDASIDGTSSVAGSHADISWQDPSREVGTEPTALTPSISKVVGRERADVGYCFHWMLSPVHRCHLESLFHCWAGWSWR